MIYPQAIDFLHRLQLFGAVFGLKNTRRLAALAGNPQERLRFIHVAGTNGKGSVCAMLDTVYRAAGLKTGLYTSPHLVHFGERMQICGEPLTEAAVIRLVEQMKELLAEGTRRGWWKAIEEETDSIAQPALAVESTLPAHPTFFEVVTVMALIHFAEAGCELVLWETGLGGRLDATNIVRPLASVITNVSVEHAAVLGDTVTKIAAEKSGIIKPGVPVVTGTKDGEALQVIREVAASRLAALRVVEDPSRSEDWATGMSPFRGYQRTNARLVQAVVEELQKLLPVAAAKIAEGLQRFSWPGRLQEIVKGATRFLIDGAHNPAGMRALRESLQAEPAWRPAPVIFGTFADKEVTKVLQELLPLASRIVLVPVASPRSAQPVQLQEAVRKLNSVVDTAVCASLEEGLAAVSEESQVLVTGSLFLVGETLERLGHGGLAADERALNDWKPAP